MTLVLAESDVEMLLPRAEANRLVEHAFRLLGEGKAENFVRQRVGPPGRVLNTMTAMSPALGYIGVKVYPVLRRDVTQGSTSTLLLYSLDDGGLAGVIESDILGQRRTGSASWLATKLLAPSRVNVLTVIGAGWQAREQVRSLVPLFPDLKVINVVGRRPESTRQCVADLRADTDLEIVAESETEVAVRQADVLVTATGSTEPVFDGAWLTPGTHINAVGSNYSSKRELDGTALQRCDLVAVDAPDVAAQESGDLLRNNYAAQHAIGLDRLLLGKAEGRTDDDQITLFESHGLAIQDLACGIFVLQAARRAGHGATVPLNGRHQATADTVAASAPGC